jgi:multimeric flavodoxin WrbA
MHRNGSILIVYAGRSESGATAKLAKLVAEGAASCPGSTVKVVRAEDATKADVNGAGAIVLGTGDYNGNPEPALLSFIDDKLKAGKSVSLMDGVVSAGFCTAAGVASGGQPILESIARATMTFGAVFVGGSTWETSQGVLGIVADGPGDTWTWASGQEHLQAQARDLGRRVADMASFFPGSYADVRKYPHGRETVEVVSSEAMNFDVYWLCFWISVALVFILAFQKT